MKLSARQLDKHVSRGLAPVYLVSGDEPLLVDEALAKLRTAAKAQGFTEREAHVAERTFDWDELAGGLQNLSLFAARRIIEVRLPTGKPGREGSRFFVESATAPADDTVIFIITPKLDRNAAKSKWVTTVTKAGVWLDLRAPKSAELPGWIVGRLSAAGLRADRDALQLLVAQIEGNLLAAKQEIDKLALLAPDGHVTVDTVRTSVADGARFDVFQLGEAALGGNGARASRILFCLEREGVAAPLVLWSLVRESTAVADVILRISGGQSPARACADAGVWKNRENLMLHAIRGRDSAFARGLIRSASRADRVVKGSLGGQPWNALLELTMTLAGGDGWRAEIA